MADTGFKSPTAQSGAWADPTNAYSSNDAYASAVRTNGTKYHAYYDFTFNVPEGATIDGILVEIECYSSEGAGADLQVALSYDGGSNHTAYKSNAVTTSEGTETYGGAADLWGRAWDDAELGNANFRVNLAAVDAAPATYYVDHIQVKVFYTEGGGSTSDERDAKTTGKLAATSERGAKKPGQQGDTDYWGLKFDKDNSKIVNRVYVRGGSYLSDEVTINMVADGEQTVFNLPEKPSDISVEEDSVAKTVGTKNLHDPADYDYLVNYQEKYIETVTAPTVGTVISVSYKYYIPVLVAVQDDDSITEFGVFEKAIFDNSIKTLQQARDRAQAEITDFGDTIVGGKFFTTTDGFRAGQYVNITVSDLGISADFYIKKVVATSLGGGQFIYEVIFGSPSDRGIIKFLTDMLEADKNSLQIGESEAVDELFEVGPDEAIITDAITDTTLTTPPFTWGSFTWGAFEWG